MRAQEQTKIISGRSFRRAPSRCQKFWQGIIVLATLALAMAANAAAAPKCSDLFALPRAKALKESKSATVHFKFGLLTNELLQLPAVRTEVMTAVMRDLEHLTIANHHMRNKLDDLQKRSSSNSREKQMLELRSKIRSHELGFSQLQAMARAVASRRPLVESELQLLGTREFSETLPYGKSADVKRFSERVAELDSRGALSTTRVPASLIEKIIYMKRGKKIITLIVVANLLYGGYDMYKASADQTVPENIQTVLVYE